MAKRLTCHNIYGGHMCSQPVDHDGPHTCGDELMPCSGVWSDEQGHYPEHT